MHHADCCTEQGFTTFMPTVTGGAALVLIAIAIGTAWILRAIRSVNRPADDAWDHGYQAGHDKGWIEGRRSSRPTIVRIQKRAAGA